MLVDELNRNPREGERQFIGVISDTHGLLRPEALASLHGAVAIVHAGDIGKPEVLDALRGIAPVYPVRGNVDGPWAKSLPSRRVVVVEDNRLLVLHDRHTLKPPEIRGVDAVISGHSHRSAVRREDGVLYLNPGSAGPRRSSMPVSVARLYFHGHILDPEIIELKIP